MQHLKNLELIPVSSLTMLLGSGPGLLLDPYELLTIRIKLYRYSFENASERLIFQKAAVVTKLLMWLTICHIIQRWWV